jgi:group I intron endonuclease
MIGRRDLCLGPLTNLTDGGDGRLNGRNSPESNEKMRKSLLDYHKNLEEKGIKIKRTEQTIMKLREINKGKNNPMWGKKHTDKVKQEQSDRVSGLKHPRYGKKHSEETIKLIKEKRNATVDQEKMNEESRLRNNKAILQFSLDGEFIQEFESIKVAANSTGLSESLIGKTCRGQIKAPRKFIFKFKDENSKVLGNSYQIKEGDIYQDFKLVKRNKVTVIVENLSGEIMTLKKVDYPQFWDKNKIE